MSTRLERAIYRVEDESHQVHGWLVKLALGAQAFRKFFGDATWRGRDKSLTAARAYRDKILAAKAKDAPRQMPAVEKRRASIVAGLECYCSADTSHLKKALQLWFWRATWTTPEGKTERAEFSVREHGDELAFRMALQARRVGLGGGLRCGTPGCLHHTQGVNGCAHGCSRRP